jgi:hypothetical protein
MTVPTSESNSSERRLSARYRFSTAVEIEWGASVLKGSVSDISAEGMFIEVSEPLWIGASFSAQLALDKPLRVDCTVRRVTPGRGMGVSIFVPGEEGQKRFAGLLKALAQKSPVA